jgi:hypothetical protein
MAKVTICLPKGLHRHHAVVHNRIRKPVLITIDFSILRASIETWPITASFQFDYFEITALICSLVSFSTVCFAEPCLSGKGTT